MYSSLYQFVDVLNDDNGLRNLEITISLINFFFIIRACTIWLRMVLHNFTQLIFSLVMLKTNIRHSWIPLWWYITMLTVLWIISLMIDLYITWWPIKKSKFIAVWVITVLVLRQRHLQSVEDLLSVWSSSICKNLAWVD